MKIEKGKAHPLTLEEKVTLAVKEAARQNEEWSGCLVWVTSLSITKSSQNPLTETKVRVFAEGTASLGFRCLQKDMILNPKELNFKIQAIDSTDEWGLPDIKLENFSFKSDL
jgi:hypothetical protein